jgi:hypothetical protein
MMKKNDSSVKNETGIKLVKKCIFYERYKKENACLYPYSTTQKCAGVCGDYREK